MKKICILLLIIFAAVIFTGCSDDSDVPSGMQLVYGSDAAGYYFYAPEEWTVSDIGTVKSAFVSKTDSTSLSFARIDPSLTNKTGKSDADYFFEDYFNEMFTEFPEDTKLTIAGEATTFGAKDYEADKAVKYAYNYEYSYFKFGFLQILMSKGEDFYIFTFSSQLEERTEGTTYYDFYADKLLSVIDNFRFVDKNGAEENKEYTKDSDGYILISDSSLSAFDLYVPQSFSPDFSNAMVSATHADGTNINMTRANPTSSSYSGYWTIRKTELSAIIDKDSLTVEKENEPTSLADAESAFLYKYSYTYGGKEYKVYQVLAVKGMRLYSLTFTASAENYNAHIEEFQKVISKVVFK